MLEHIGDLPHDQRPQAPAAVTAEGVRRRHGVESGQDRGGHVLAAFLGFLAAGLVGIGERTPALRPESTAPIGQGPLVDEAAGDQVFAAVGLGQVVAGNPVRGQAVLVRAAQIRVVPVVTPAAAERVGGYAALQINHD
jgi:hypothetical protein